MTVETPKFLQNYAADVSFHESSVQKITKQRFSDQTAAALYVADCETYHAGLMTDGWALPTLRAMSPTDDLRVMQVWEKIPGESLDQRPTIAGVAELIGQLLATRRDELGRFEVTPDHRLSNFMQDAGRVLLVDTIPPLTTADRVFPYHRLSVTLTPAGKLWCDAAFRKPEAAAARMAAQGARALSRVEPPVSFIEAAAAIKAAITPAERQAVVRGMAPFLSAHALLRGSKMIRGDY